MSDATVTPPIQLEISFKDTNMTAELTNCLIDIQLARDYAAKHELPEAKKEQVLKYVRRIKLNCKEMQDLMKREDGEMPSGPDLTQAIQGFVFDSNKLCNARIVASLKRYGIHTMKDVVQLSRVDLAIIPHINHEALKAVDVFMFENDIPWKKTSTFAQHDLDIPRELSPTATDVEDFLAKLDWRLQHALSRDSQPNNISREISNVRNRWNLAVNKFTVAALANKTVPPEKSMVFRSKVQTRVSRLRGLNSPSPAVV